mmetsp:Transcript_40801/g.49690  ORF Transcript_40801/g.49690 Transcript_40801/m.49690 type:complete len:197 (-) Transcript_40801:50-640(-)|eukprot:CAMPEP_0172500122 /NCGR_PEP_ID=MMETSP1066-20121228/134884_1 /TAXON_ID=671091 /ORGANISM="Coscinodiscus wailesii, Strain CCMP2513" /LENGTH=196 /DNA_ID=CAMNT_0013274209 /DNA_START=118 /DNA_END=708 /DNA_ORIENTATION=-
MNTEKTFEGDAGAPLPSFSTANIDLTTVAPALGVPRQLDQQPDYLDYDQKGRGIVVTMFANCGASYLMGITAGSIYGLREGLANTPSSRWKVKLSSVLNHCGRQGSRAGNLVGVLAIIYSLYEGYGDKLEIDRHVGGNYSIVPPLSAFLTGATYKMTHGPRIALMSGSIGLSAVGVTYLGYSLLGIPYGSKGFLFF